MKGKINLGIREVKVIQVIQTLTCIGTGTEDDPARTVWQYWTMEGELLSSSEYGMPKDLIS
jgi:hypothetical protein